MFFCCRNMFGHWWPYSSWPVKYNVLSFAQRRFNLIASTIDKFMESDKPFIYLIIVFFFLLSVYTLPVFIGPEVFVCEVRSSYYTIHNGLKCVTVAKIDCVNQSMTQCCQAANDNDRHVGYLMWRVTLRYSIPISLHSWNEYTVVYCRFIFAITFSSMLSI